MRGSSLQKLIWIGPVSENVSRKVIGVLAKFHAFQFEQFSLFLVDNSWTSRIVRNLDLSIKQGQSIS